MKGKVCAAAGSALYIAAIVVLVVWWLADHGSNDVGAASRYADWRFITGVGMAVAMWVFGSLMESFNKEEEKEAGQSE